MVDVGMIIGNEWPMFPERANNDPEFAWSLLEQKNERIARTERILTRLRDDLSRRERWWCQALEDGRSWVHDGLANSITSRLTTIHLLERYALCLVRDSLRLESIVRGEPIPVADVMHWNNAVMRQRQMAPNVHDHYLWRSSLPSHINGVPNRNQTVQLELRRIAE